MEKIREMLKGKKTYLVALGAVIAALIGYANGVSFIDTLQLIITAVIGCTIRAGVSKNL